ncbi:RNA polymerase sigma factor [Piscinibacter sp. XHJ-5]|uniref:RNA polymerase sigma factor n=1 Tax=Piscinibacter sp. XHJ-5 TaxID=3037797 RepID=UPI0024535256|nr:RNA polymerase sigma factor [Piscinibacter sp. XHJ-5]
MSESHEALRLELVALLPRLRRFARTITHHREDADDLVQLSVERALLRLGQWQPGTRLDSWMFTIMKNAWIDEVRSRTRRDALLLPEQAGENVGHAVGEWPVDAQHRRMDVQRAMATLNDDQRMAVGLVLVEGLPYKEAAEVLGIPIGTLTSRLARAREALQAVLSGTEEV